MVFLFVFFFWDSYNSNVGAFHIVLETKIEKMQERFNKDLEEIKKSQYIMNNAINDIKALWRQQIVE